MKKIITQDGSETFIDEAIDESYHSKSGALQESFEKFAIPALKDKLKYDEIIILDLFFGLGYNTACALHYIFQNNPEMRVKVICIEKDERIINEIKNINMPSIVKKEYELIKKLSMNKEYSDEKIYIKLIVGDVLKEIKLLQEKFDCVFFDSFSPKKAPEHWTEELFRDIFLKMREKGILTTYSCASIVRKNLTTAGFNVIDGPSVGRRAPSTIAIKEKEKEEMPPSE